MEVPRSVAVPEAAQSRSEARELRIVLEIERAGPCCMDEVADQVIDVDVRLDEETCNVDATLKDEESETVTTMFFSEQLCEYCPGKVFSKYDCLPRYRRIDEGSFLMETYASDTDTIADIVSEVRTISDSVSVKSIVPTDDSNGSEIEIVDLTEMTNKQRQALHYAKEAGYYDSGTDVSLQDLAERMEDRMDALDVPIPDAYPPDHVALLLEYASLLAESGSVDDLAAFVETELDWIDALATKVANAAAAAPFHRYCVDVLVAAVRRLRAELGITGPSETEIERMIDRTTSQRI